VSQRNGEEAGEEKEGFYATFGKGSSKIILA
jgi:hypothetical protein